ncbi:MAG: Ig-like domain-containing protein, partial [Bacteroidales bacterium]
RWFPQTPKGKIEPEPNYSGGIILDYDDPSIVYLSKQVDGVFEIFKYTTTDHGQSWESEALTENTPKGLLNARPIVPRHHKKGFFDVVWMRGRYEFYADERYNTSLVFPKMEKTDDLKGINIKPDVLSLYPAESREVKVNFLPFSTRNKSLNWSSSNEKVLSLENGILTALAPGRATITATGFNGITGKCRVVVKKPRLLKKAFFDFGTEESPLFASAIKVTGNSLLNGSYGWLSPVISRDRGEAMNEEERDFNMSGSPSVFRVHIKNGAYKVTVKQGDLSYMHDQMCVKVNGQVMISNFTTATGQVLSTTFEVNTNNEKLDFEFSRSGSDPNWVVNSIRIEPI